MSVDARQIPVNTKAVCPLVVVPPSGSQSGPETLVGSQVGLGHGLVHGSSLTLSGIQGSENGANMFLSDKLDGDQSVVCRSGSGQKSEPNCGQDEAAM